MKTHKISIILGMLTLAMVILACTINIGGPDYPSPVIPVSTDATGEMVSSMQTAVAAGSTTGQVTLVITESQLTSYLTYKLEAQADPFLTNPQVYLQNGQIQLYGTAKKGYFEATAAIILTAGVDDQGHLAVELTSADFGPLPVPAGLTEIITASLQEAFTGAIGPTATGIRLESVTIADGEMTILGQIK
jgi:hypothetical protein